MMGIGLQLNATAQDSLTIDQCRAMAVEHNRQLQQAREQRKKSGYDMMAMKANYLPKLNFQAFDLLNTTSGSIGMPSATLPVYSYNPQMGQFLPAVLTDASGNVTGLSQYAEFPAMTVKYKLPNLLNASLSVIRIYSSEMRCPIFVIVYPASIFPPI